MPKPMGRPPKRPEDRFVTRTYSVPPDLWAEVEQFIPVRERSPFIQACLRREVARRKREGERQQPSGQSSPE
jgi:metal-responsive CopG/Arc/MetJ family transcriptional regulator